MVFKRWYFKFILSLLVASQVITLSQCQNFTLTILHLNDFHARFLETNVFSGRCSVQDQQRNKCFGGFSRISTKVKELRESEPNVLFLAAGDYFQGTIWYTIHKWKPFIKVLNKIGQDAMSLGNHEFDDGVAGLIPFLEEVWFPVLAANIDVSNEPSMAGKILPSIVIEKENRKIGIIGYVTTETVFISSPGQVKFIDESEAVRRESRRLKEQGVNIIIALGHAGYKKDMTIAQTVEDVDIVVGGHTNTFLYEGTEPSTETRVGSYPTVVTQKSGRKVLVVQAYAFGKYLGHLSTTFDPSGEVSSWGGNPILLDNSVSQDEDILNMLSPWQENIQSTVTEMVGRTFVFLDGDRKSCRMKECNMGNLIVNAIVHQNAKYPDEMEWATTGLAVVNGGGIRSSIDELSLNGSISLEDILAIAPFQNTIDIVELKGKHVLEMFEHSVSDYDSTGLDAPGKFLQVSGFQVVFDISQPVGSRVLNLSVRCSKCRVPDNEKVSENEVYKIAMPSFLANGGDNYTVIRDNKKIHHLTGLLDSDILLQYIRLYSPIYQGIENRILFRSKEDYCLGPIVRGVIYNNLDAESKLELDERNPRNVENIAKALSINLPWWVMIISMLIF